MPISDHDRDMMIRTVMGVAGDQPDPTQSAYAHVILNRTKTGLWGGVPSQVVMARNQFEPWSTRTKELQAIDAKSKDYARTAGIIDAAVSGAVEDPTGGATHFLDQSKTKRGVKAPEWAKGDFTAVGNHKFFKPGQIAANEDEFGHLNWDVPIAAKPKEEDEFGHLNWGTVAPTGTPKEELPPELTPKWGAPTPEGLALSKQRGFLQPVVDGIPIIGPTIDAVRSAGSAALAPHLGDVGDTTFNDRYMRNMGLTHEASRLYAEENPWKSFGGNMLGAAALYPIAARTMAGRLAMGLPTMKTPGFGGQFYSGIAGGAGINALDATMRGHDPGMGAMIGATTGAASPVIKSAFDVGSKFLSNQIGRIPDALRSFNPVAREKLTDAMRGGMNDPVGPHSFFGESTPGLTKLAQGISFGDNANAEAIVRNAYYQRAAEAPTRMNSYLDGAFGPRRNILDDARLITEERARLADPLYSQWRSMEVFPTQGLKELLPRLEKAGAFNMAEEISGVSGREMYKNFFTTGARKNYPTAEGWDMVKRGLDRRINQLLKTEGGGELGRELLTLKGEMLAEIRKTPAGKVWDQARSEFASKSSLIDQLEAGRDTFIGGRAGTSVDELREELRHLSRPERIARINSARDVISEAMGESRRGATAMREKLLSENGQKKLQLLLGKGTADDLVAMLEHERQMGSSAEGKFKQVIGGSQTASNTEAVNALKAPNVNEFWEPQLNKPLTWIPGVPQLAHQLQPSTVAQAAREASYANALHQMAPALVMPNSQSTALRASIGQDLARREWWERGARRGAFGVNALLLHPGATAFRLESSNKDKSPMSLVRAAN